MGNLLRMSTFTSRFGIALALATAACSHASDSPASHGADSGDDSTGAGHPGGNEATGDASPDPSNATDGGLPAAPTGTIVAAHGRLQVAGSRIQDVHGVPIQLKGMSLFWSQWGGAFWNARVVDSLVDDWHATVIRAAMGVEQGGYLTNASTEEARVKVVVEAAIARGIYVIVDWHDHNATQHTEQAKAFFSKMADAYGQRPNVIFEIFNEPEYQSWADVKGYANAVIPAIREKAPKSLIIVGSPHWSQDVDLAAADPVADSNVAYALHFYAATHKNPLRDKATTALGKGLPLFVTEWGTPDASGGGSPDLVESQAWLDFLVANKVSWCNWSLFDKPEAASALVAGASVTGGWADTARTPSGRFVKSKIVAP
jgi:endoglucanase